MSGGLIRNKKIRNVTCWPYILFLDLHRQLKAEISVKSRLEISRDSNKNVSQINRVSFYTLHTTHLR